ncbi:MAG: aldo/keto reductase [Leptospirales bacterium]|jgi:diketogulonate reductase-like aldo/keto reductase
MRRREFLRRCSASAAAFAGGRAGLVFTPAAIASPELIPRLQAAPADPRPELTRVIPASGERIPALGMGTYISFDAAGDPGRKNELRGVLRLFYAAGGRLVDSSPMYGSAESVFGELSAGLGLNRDLFVATRVWTRGGAAGQKQMRSSLRKLGREKIELMQIHNLVDWRAHYATLRRWQESGRFRYIGVTHYTPAAFSELEGVLKNERFDFVQFPYSAATRSAEKRLLPFCQDRGVGVIVNRPYEGGDLFRSVRGKPLPDFARELECESYGQLFLKFLLAHSAVTCVIPATSKPRHMRDNMGAAHGPLPDRKQREAIARLVGHSS